MFRVNSDQAWQIFAPNCLTLIDILEVFEKVNIKILADINSKVGMSTNAEIGIRIFA